MNIKQQIKKLEREAVRLARETFATGASPERLVAIESRLLQIEAQLKVLYA